MLWIKLAKLTWLELWQSRSYKMILLIALVAPAFAVVMGALFMVDIGKVYMDAIAASAQLMMIAFLIFVVVVLLSKDIFERVCYILLTPPVRRTDYFAGRFVGFVFAFMMLLLALFVSSLIVAVFYIGAKPEFYQSGFSWITLAQMMFFYAFQYIAVLGLVFFIASWASGDAEMMLFVMASLVFTWIFPPVLQALQSPDVMAETPAFIMPVLDAVYAMIPHLNGADIALQLAHGDALSLVQMTMYVAEHSLYAVVCFMMGLMLFKRRDL
ncbi:ABC-2 transporter permease [Ghiorsea bivora]|uniref:hypothetical protein n=1 Tax=Ghiorsea bivora TaxID=1485545 RepID=UPI0012FD0896|nr:hypothetical protein [Ghiorsea bivora]